ncbi:MAG: divalent-cation tolerance protein CutA [Candidatus Vogelbacteria bacterium]|nr:divalent-cation tolerance protein CutA [Candidatus Vogelbacteria bacterium]
MEQHIWVLVNCNSSEEAEKIGRAILETRLGVCFDIFSRELSAYFWPAKSGRIETTKGALLIIETFKNHYASLKDRVKKMHSDELPFIAYLNIEGADEEFQAWMKGELEK